MSMKLRLGVSEDLVVDARSARDLQDGVAELGHVFQKLQTGVTVEIVEAWNHRIRQEQTVATQELDIADDRPTRRHTADDLLIRATTGFGDSF